MAETVVWTATYKYVFNQGETEDQVRIISLAKIRKALLNAARPTIRETDSFKKLPPITALEQILAAGVMRFDTKSMELQKSTHGYTVSLKVAGSIDKDTLPSDLDRFTANHFRFDNAQANRLLADNLLAQLEDLNQELGDQNHSGDAFKTLSTKRVELVNRLAAIGVMNDLVSPGFSVQSHDPATLIKQLNKAISLDDRNAWLYLHRGRVYSDLKDWVAAYQDFFRATQMNTPIIHAHELKGDALNAIGDKDAALSAYTAAIDLDLSNADLFLKRGRVFLEIGNSHQARKDFFRAIELDPSNPTGLVARGKSWIEANQLPEAINDFTAALELNPDDASTYAIRGRTHLAAGLAEAGCDDLVRACELADCEPLDSAVDSGRCQSQDAELFEKWSRMSHEAVLAKKWERAIQAATLAIYHNPQAFEPYMNRAYAYAETDRFELALQDTFQAVKLAPDSAEAYNNRGLVYEKQGELDKAAQSYFKACEMGLKMGCSNYLNASKSKTIKNLGKIDRLMQQSARMYHQKDWRAVVSLTSQVIQESGSNPQAYTLRAAAKAQQGQYEEAIADCNAAIKIDPFYGLAYNNRGYALERMGVHDEALVDYRVGCLMKSEPACQNYERLSATQP